MQFDNSDQLNKYMADRVGGKVMLSFSCGKDSIVAWLKMREYFIEITPYYLYLIPDLEFVEQSIQYYEQYFGCHIWRLPHPSLHRWMNNCVFQPPDRVEWLRSLKLASFDYDEIRSLVWTATGNKGEGFYGVGIRAVDSPIRWTAIKTHGPVSENQHKFYPIYDFRKADMLTWLEKAQVKLPVDYRMFGRSFDGIDARFLGPIKKYFPKDYQKIIEYIPMADMELYRREKWEKR